MIFKSITISSITTVLLIACSPTPEQLYASHVVESVSDAGAIAIYRHEATMYEKAQELQMIHPIEMKEIKNDK